ncbi:MAG: hypothetical protein N3E36_05215 [Sulfolobales archaeon]|nr:hypothetical protein [Sulfolobales archaeon]MCX8199409.1 hypothetical protein [Sulfolobales archaeon]MDW8170277.1 hypothetical protein [Desulfurococcaceae archaeon]
MWGRTCGPARDGFNPYTVYIALPEAPNTLLKHVGLINDLDMEEATNAAEDILQIYSRVNVVNPKVLSREAFQLTLAEDIQYMMT